MDASGDQSDEKQAGEKPIGIEEQRTIESQETQAEEETPAKDVEPSSTTTEEIIGSSLTKKVKQKSKPILRDQSTKLFEQFIKYFQISKAASGNTTNMLKQIQKQLTQIDKFTSANNKQEVVIRQLVVQVKAMQKQLDKMGRSVNRIKNVPNVTRKGAKNKNTKERDGK